MLFDSIEFHNAADLIDTGDKGLLLCRVPESLLTFLEPATAARCQSPAGMELRFHADRLPVEISFTVEDAPVSAAIFLGDHLFREYFLTPGQHDLTIENEPWLDRYFFHVPKGSFDPDLIRILLFSTNAKVYFRGIRCAGRITPPQPGDLPPLRCLCYGSSITNGHHATIPSSTYCARLGQLLGADVRNLGMGGAALLEPSLGEYLASCSFDLFLAEISVNLLLQGCSEEEYCLRMRGFLAPIHRAHPEAVKAVVSVLPCFLDWGYVKPGMKSDVRRWRKLTQEITAEFPGWLFLDGSSLLEASDLSADLIHPQDSGMERLAARLADRLRPFLPHGAE